MSNKSFKLSSRECGKVKVTNKTSPPCLVHFSTAVEISKRLRSDIFDEQTGQDQTEPQVCNPEKRALPVSTSLYTSTPVPVPIISLPHLQIR
ncbi:hypothetical protein [Candidatus Thioglobus sp.]|uniref:hypothetical protein n=1 Tax=Candidatus Thioglobus sp. TaxID=2026721 RepID=UPI003D0FBD6C